MLPVAATFALNNYQNDHAAALLARLAGHGLAAPDQVCQALEQLANVHARRARLDDVQAALERLVSLPWVTPRQKVWAIARMATNAKQMGNPQQCWTLLDRAEVEARQCGDQQALAQVFKTRGANLITGGDQDSAIDFTRQGLELAMASGAFEVAQEALQNLVILHRLRSDFEQALACLGQMEELAAAGRVVPPADRWANSRGNIYWRMGRLDEAEACYQTALDASRRQGNVADAATAEGNLGNILQGRGDNRGALRLYMQAARQCAEAGLVNHHALWVNNVGNAHYYLKEYDLALAAYRQAEVLHGQAGDRGAQSSVVANIGLLLQEKGQTEAALDHYRHAETIARASGAKVAAAGHMFRRAELLRLLQRYAEALAVLRQALQLRLEHGQLLPADGVAFQVDMARLHLALGDHAAARQAVDAARHHAQAVQGAGQPVRASVTERIADLDRLQQLAVKDP